MVELSNGRLVEVLVADSAVAPDPQASEDDAALVGFVERHDASCPVCEYSLRGLRSTVCPECAAHLSLQVGSKDLHLGPWFFAVVSISLGLGFDTVFCLLVFIGSTIAVVMNGGLPPLKDIVPVLIILGIMVPLWAACVAGLSALYQRRVAWRRMSIRRQWKTAAAIFFGTGLVHAAAGALLIKIMS
jgi:hypothetical protein